MRKLLTLISILFFLSCDLSTEPEDCAGVEGGTAEILTYWEDVDADGLGAGESSEFCDVLVEEGWVLNNDDNDDNCLSNVHDCLGVCDGDALEDMCGTCDNDTENDCVQDCVGVWGGTSYEINDIDGNVYCTIEIGDQVWMSENLKVTHYNNGDPITHITNNGDWGSFDEGQYGIYDNDPSNADTYGNLYNWAVVDDDRGVCPEGWHVPTDDEWTVLTDYLGGTSVAGGKMKEAGLEHWNSPNTGATNESGFAGLPSGYRDYNYGSYNNIGNYGCFWSSSEYNSTTAWSRLLYNNYANVTRGSNYKLFGFSVRCLRD